MANRYTDHLPGAIFIITRNTGEFFLRHILCKCNPSEQSTSPLHEIIEIPLLYPLATIF